MEKRTLLLTSFYFPHRILRWEDAITLLYQEKADSVVDFEEEVRSPSVTMKIPAVLRLRRNTGRVKRGVKFSRINIFTRDGFKCAYCGNKFPMSKLTYDHVVPRARGGRTVFENIVTACKRCNGIKGDRSCDESGMFPLHKARRPKELPMTQPIFDMEDVPAEWRDYLHAAVVV